MDSHYGHVLSSYRYYIPPQINDPEVQLELSVEQPLRTVVERLKAISPHGECLMLLGVLHFHLTFEDPNPSLTFK